VHQDKFLCMMMMLITTIFPRIYTRARFMRTPARALYLSKQGNPFPSGNPPHALRLLYLAHTLVATAPPDSIGRAIIPGLCAPFCVTISFLGKSGRGANSSPHRKCLYFFSRFGRLAPCACVCVCVCVCVCAPLPEGASHTMTMKLEPAVALQLTQRGLLRSSPPLHQLHPTRAATSSFCKL